MKRNKRSKQKADGEISSAETVNLSVVSEKAEPDPEKQRVVLPDGKGRATDANPSVDAEPLRDYIDDGTTAPLVSAKFGKSKIDVYRRGAVTELVIDGKVYAEYKSVEKDDYGIYARYKGAEITSEHRNRYLYSSQNISVNGVIVAEEQKLV